MVQYLVEGGISTFLTMRIATLIHTHNLVTATTTLYQAEYKASTQSWLGLSSSHLMRWRYSILVEPREVDTKSNLLTVHAYFISALSFSAVVYRPFKDMFLSVSQQ